MDEKKIENVIKKIYLSSLGCRKSEKVLVFTDYLWLNRSDINKKIFEHFVAVAEELGFQPRQYVYGETGRNGAEPPKELWTFVFGERFINEFNFEDIIRKNVGYEQLLNKKDAVINEELPDAIVAIPFYSTSHTNFRKLLNAFGTRYASMPNVEEAMFYGALDVDYGVLKSVTQGKKAEIEQYEAVNISSPAGTQIYVNFKARQIHTDTGDLSGTGSFGNLPAGEVFVAPVEDMTEGKFVVEYGMGRRLSDPLEVTVEKGKVVKMKGDNELKGYLEKVFQLNSNNAVVAELGIGTNNMAKDVFNVLEAEKIMNTCHIALGDNSTFGGKNVATAHLDFVIFNPDYRWC